MISEEEVFAPLIEQVRPPHSPLEPTGSAHPDSTPQIQWIQKVHRLHDYLGRGLTAASPVGISSRIPRKRVLALAQPLSRH